jgi:pimeloyl-ACP methyl ester carboxylesterase
MEPLDVRSIGAGPRVLLVHGGVGRELAWAAQEPLAERWRLELPARRGFEPSPAAERQDFEVDAADVEVLLADEPAHCVGFSYGGVGLALAAARRPERLLSLTLIEPPLFTVALDRPEVRELMGLAAAYTGSDPAARERARAEFEELARVRVTGDPGVEAAFEEARRLAPGLRPPGEAAPDLAGVATAGVPALVASGDHHPAVEAVCDAVADGLVAERVRLAGGGHAVQRAPGFNERLERFLIRAQRDAGDDPPAAADGSGAAPIS